MSARRKRSGLTNYERALQPTPGSRRRLPVERILKAALVLIAVLLIVVIGRWFWH